MSFSDSDWSSDAAPAPALPMWLVLMAGIAIGAAVTSLAFVLVRERSPHEMPRAAALQASPAASTASPAASASPASPSKPVAALASPSPMLSNESLMPSPPSAGPATASKLSEQQRKDRAWARTYRRPAACEGNPSTDQLIECANHYIRARREFDERWRQNPQ